MLKRIHAVLSDPSHIRLENEIMSDLSNVTPENAVMLSHKLMGINGVPIEGRWHAAEAFRSKDNLLYSLVNSPSADPADSNGLKAMAEKLSDLFFKRYFAEGNNETHGIGWENLGLPERRTAHRISPHGGVIQADSAAGCSERNEAVV